MRKVIFAILGVATFVACGPESATRSVRLQFEPMALTGGGYSNGPTDIAVESGCDLGGVTAINVLVYSSEITTIDKAAVRYEAADISEQCELSVVLPVGGQIEVVIEAISGSELVRKAIVAIPAIGEGEEINVPVVLWPATRIQDEVGEGPAVDIDFVDVMRQFDGFQLELVFTDIVYPASQGGAMTVDGFISLAEGDRDYSLLLSPSENGMVLVPSATPAEQTRIPFEFVPGALRIFIPYSALGAEGKPDVIVAPDVTATITLINRDGGAGDLVPDSGVPFSFK